MNLKERLILMGGGHNMQVFDPYMGTYIESDQSGDLTIKDGAIMRKEDV